MKPKMKVNHGCDPAKQQRLAVLLLFAENPGKQEANSTHSLMEAERRLCVATRSIATRLSLGKVL